MKNRVKKHGNLLPSYMKSNIVKQLVAIFLSFALVGLLSHDTASEEFKDEFIPVKNPKTLDTDRLPAERIPIGVAGDYKPCIALLRNGDLAIIASIAAVRREGNKVFEPSIWFRSTDGGRSWSNGVPLLNQLGAEAYLGVLKDGTVFITTELAKNDVLNRDGYTYSYLHRSTDNGMTWESLRITSEDLPGAPPKAWTLTSRTPFELADGTVILTVSAPKEFVYLWRSKDRGKTWDKTLRCRFDGADKDTMAKVWWPFLSETIFWQAATGDLIGIVRSNMVEGLVPPLPDIELPFPKGQEHKYDGYNRMVLFRSKDDGRNWKLEELGSYYGEHYPSVLRLQDGRLLLTFTVRSLRYPLGVQAVFGEERPDGFSFDFKNDRMILDGKTPNDKTSGGGYGPTVQLADGTLVTVYSYRGQDDQTHVEVVRWKLPAKKPYGR
jgi:hypothetical protein